MNELKAMFAAHYIAAKTNNDPVLVTPEASRLLRGLLELTPQAAADMASIKRTRLLNFEKGGTPLSVRDARWLQSVFETAGAEFFMGQNKLHVRINGQDVIAFGKPAKGLCDDLPYGEICREQREIRDWSQRDTAAISGVARGRITAIENNRPANYFLTHLLKLKEAFAEYPPARRPWRLRIGLKVGVTV